VPDKLDYFKIITGKTFDETYRLPTTDEIIKRQIKQLQSKYPLRLVGTSQEGQVFISEEEREVNCHILGAPGEGKSKFLESSIRQDIDRGIGLCLLDPSDKGQTYQDILSYCAKIDYKKVLIIDPKLCAAAQKYPCLAPLKRKYAKMSVEGVMETVNILFDTKSSDTPRIRRHLQALLRILAKTGNTLFETQYFSDYKRDADKRYEILYRLNPEDRDLSTIENLFRSQYHFEQYFYSTINRLDLFWEEPLKTMLAANSGIDFVKLIREGWVILVNLAPGKYINPEESQLLGVLIISELIQAIDILADSGWKGVHYLYIDEAARFATPQIDTLLSFKRKSGLRLVLAHHYFKQFDNQKVLNSIKNNARIKLMFDTPNYDDRLEMVKALGYGGDIPPVLAAYANQNIPKQHAVIRKNKESPVRIRIPDVEPVKINKDKLDSYIEKILASEWYLTSEQITKQINARSVPKNSKGSQYRKASDRKADNKTSLPGGIQSRREQQSVSKSSQKSSDAKDEKPIKI
jgi:hypothetical protein